MTMTTLRTWAVIGLMTASLPVTALAQSGARTPYRQTPAVLAQLTDVPIPLDAPGLTCRGWCSPPRGCRTWPRCAG